MSLLKEETRTEERALSDELARIQESVAAPPLMALSRFWFGGCGEECGVVEDDYGVESGGYIYTHSLSERQVL